MAKPIIASIKPFDATIENTISFSYSGNQPYKNRLILRNADTLDIVYDETQTTMRLEHKVPSNTLTNGIKYTAEIQCIDNSGVESVFSDKSFFWVFSTPYFKFNVHAGETIKSSSLTTNIVYEQAEGEKLSQTQFFLYDANKMLISQSKIIYASENIEHTYVGLNNATIYYIRALGYTENGMTIDTDYTQIFVKFENPGTYAAIYANQDSNGTGTVNYYTNINIIRPERDDYILENGMIDLTNDSIIYDRGFDILNDFTMAVKHTYSIGKILELKNSNETIELYMIESDTGVRYKLVVDDIYKIYSEEIFGVFDDNVETFTVYIRKKNNVYGLTLFYDYTYLVDGFNIWYKNDEPNAKKLEVWVDAGDDISSSVVNRVVSDTEPTGIPKDTLWIGGNS